MLRSAPAGTGIIAGGPMRAVFEALGMHDVVSKSLGSSNPYNLVRATFDALKPRTARVRSRLVAASRFPCCRPAAVTRTPPRRRKLRVDHGKRHRKDRHRRADR